jgi:hypothetical protein
LVPFPVSTDGQWRIHVSQRTSFPQQVPTMQEFRAIAKDCLGIAFALLV